MSDCKKLKVITPEPRVRFFGRIRLRDTCDKIKKANFNHRKVK